MADKEHFELAMRDVNAWNQWRAEHPKEKPDLSYAVMRGAGFRRVRLAWGFYEGLGDGFLMASAMGSPHPSDPIWRPGRTGVRHRSWD
jgi:hypothetical protein